LYPNTCTAILGLYQDMRIVALLVYSLVVMGDEDSEHHEGSDGISLSISKSSTKGTVEHPEDSVEEIHQESSGSRSTNKENSTLKPVGTGEMETHNTDEETAIRANSTDSAQSIDDASTRSVAIAHQTFLFFENLQNVSLTFSELASEGINAATNIRTLSAYTELLIKCLDQMESLQSDEKTHYWALQDAVKVCRPMLSA